jgi:sugar phosphate isomerase/epimerase
MENRKPHSFMSRRHFIGSILAASTAGALLSACKSPSWQIGIFTRPFNKLEYLESFDIIAEAGFKYVGLMSNKGGRVIHKDTSIEEAARIGEEARFRGLTIIALLGHSYDRKKSVDENIADLELLVDNCAACKSPNLLFTGISAPEFVDDYYKMIAECCDYAENKKVAFTLKPHGGTNATGADCRKLIEKVGHKNFSLWYDPGNIYYYSNGEIDPVIDAADVDGLITGMCVKDFRMPKDVNVTPGTGMVDFPALFERLRQGGFKCGPLVIECLNTGEKDYLLSEALKAREFLEKLLS